MSTHKHHCAQAKNVANIHTYKYEVRSKATPIIKHTQQQKRTRKAFRDRQATATFPNCNNRHRQSSYYSLLHVPCMWYVWCVCVWNVYLGSVVPTPRYHIESITISFYGHTTGFFLLLVVDVCVCECATWPVLYVENMSALFTENIIFTYMVLVRKNQYRICRTPKLVVRCCLGVAVLQVHTQWIWCHREEDM